MATGLDTWHFTQLNEQPAHTCILAEAHDTLNTVNIGCEEQVPFEVVKSNPVKHVPLGLDGGELSDLVVETLRVSAYI